MRYLTPTENHWACDIEADNLLDKATRIWCVCVENIITGEQHAFTDSKEFLAWLRAEYILVGHNFLAYDLVMLNRFWLAGLAVRRVVDTFVLSQLYNPSFPGGHSLGIWGQRLRFPKGDFNDFSCLTDDMVTYCSRDTTLCRKLYLKLTERMQQVGFTEQGAELEHLSWNIIQNKQHRHGFPFDKKKAELLYANLRNRQDELAKEIHTLWPPVLCVVGEFHKSHKKDGSPTASYQRHLEQYPKVELCDDGGYRVYDLVAFNLGSPKQRIAKLLELGWAPSRRTKKGNPQVDEEELLDFAESSGVKELKALAKWLMVSSRANMVRTWLEAYNEDTKAIHGKLFINSTLRYRHSQPNSANVPAVRTDKEGRILYGEEGTWAYESRDLYHAGARGYSLVGIDAKGIQLRVLAHYAYSQEFVDTVLTGDPHKKNIETLGLANKAAAKKFFYTLIMGGGGGRLAADQLQFGTRLTAKEGDVLRQKMIDSIPGFNDLIKRLQNELRRKGRITLCDGTPILVPSDHMVIPYLLQGDESRLMKKASIYLDEDIRRHRLRAAKVADIHDEWQFVVHEESLERFCELALRCFPRAGDAFAYRLPIEGDIRVGKTWAETH